MEDDPLNVDTLFLALTRPPMRWGVTYEGLIVNIMGSFYFGMIMGSPLYWAVFIIVHLPMRWLTSQDHNMFRVRRLWLETKGNAVGSDKWGGSSLAALPIWPTKNASEVCGSV